jgi:ribosome-associated translation inhibitor RaiA
MSGTEPSPTELILEERLRLSGGLSEADRPRLVEALAGVTKLLKRFDPDEVDLEISVKDRDDLDQQVTFEIWLPGWGHFVATSQQQNLDSALTEVRKDMFRQLEDAKTKRQPHKGRAVRKRPS